MPLVNRLVDGLQLFLTGGASNANPDLSLGGAASSVRVRGLGAIVANPIPSIRVDNVLPANGEGDATLSVDLSGDLVYTPPGGPPGAPVAVGEGESAIVAGSASNKALRVYREAGLGLPLGSLMRLKLVDVLNGVFGHKNVSSAQRVAGVTTYRALMLRAPALAVTDLRLWFPPVVGLQAVYSLAVEVPVSGSIQTIANETTAPTGRTWVTPTSEGGSVVVDSIDAAGRLGLWIRKVFPPGGTVSSRENVQLAMKFRGQ